MPHGMVGGSQTAGDGPGPGKVDHRARHVGDEDSAHPQRFRRRSEVHVQQPGTLVCEPVASIVTCPGNGSIAGRPQSAAADSSTNTWLPGERETR